MLSETKQRSPTEIDPLPTDLESSQGKLVYLFLQTSGGATLTDLHRALGMQKMAILSVLESLSTQGLVERTDAGYAPVAVAAAN
ncbi:helix-turn-helix domain-containing protein [Halopiger thermotolerans]